MGDFYYSCSGGVNLIFLTVTTAACLGISRKEAKQRKEQRFEGFVPFGNQQSFLCFFASWLLCDHLPMHAAPPLTFILPCRKPTLL
jgi:hypothetical protein